MTFAIQLVNFFFLLIMAAFDLREKKIPVLLCAAGICCGFILNTVHGTPGFWFSLGGLLSGIPLFLISFLCRGGIGNGDYLVLAASGSLIGLSATLEAAFFAFFLAALFAVGMVLTKKAGKKDTFPFVPFFFLSQTALLFLGILGKI